MRVLDLIGHDDHFTNGMMTHTRDTGESSPLNVVVDKIQSVKDGHAKGVVVYGYMTGCPYCIRYDGVWSEACKDCPRGVFTYKVMMEDFHSDEDHKAGTPPRSFPAVYTYTRTPDGRIMRKDHSQRRDHIRKILEDVANNGGSSFEGADGEEEFLEDEETMYRGVSTPTRFPTPSSDLAAFEEEDTPRRLKKQKTPKKKRSPPSKKKRGRKGKGTRGQTSRKSRRGKKGTKKASKARGKK